uniref:Ribonuclease 3-like n=1 Tax=Acanthochromis polyacanthus TaxID=80966 RepID=A0A3Q1EDS1_9TELE
MEVPPGSGVVVLMGRQVPQLLVDATEASASAFRHPTPPPPPSPPFPTALLTRCSASISRNRQSCHLPCCCCCCPQLYCLSVMPRRFQIIACASPCVWRAGVGGVRFLRTGSCPCRLCSSRSIIDWLVVWQEALQKIRQKNTMRREVTVELSSQGFWKTGIRSDVCQHAMMLPVLTHHIRYHQCLMHLDKLIGYVFKERCLLQLAMTHPSHHLNFGMNPDHARNSLSNCGIRQPKYGDRKVHHMYMRKKGINTLINIMSRLGQDDPSPSRINHNERLEFLGDAVVEFLTSVHLYYLFPSLEEGGLATYRTAIVQNQHLAMLAKKLELDRFMLYAHGPDLCRESDLRHAMANCFEALIGAVYLEGGLEEARLLFGRLLFNSEDLREVWLNYPPHPLQVQEPQTDRQLIETSPVLQKLTSFEDSIGVLFTHVRLLARAFTLRTVGFNHLTLGHNQRMEFLGDSIMQLVATEYLFIHFPDHHEGHLTLLRSSLVNNRTQAKVAEELGMQDFAITNDKTKRPVALRTKTLADLLECTSCSSLVDFQKCKTDRQAIFADPHSTSLLVRLGRMCSLRRQHKVFFRMINEAKSRLVCSRGNSLLTF